jgi:glutamate-1-semialdehyde aminotransferase
LFLGQEMMLRRVDSPVHAFESISGQLVLITSLTVKGDHIEDIDGNEYIDHVGS